jgi:hypothetical protein
LLTGSGGQYDGPVDVVSEDPRERFAGLDDSGFVVAAVFACGHCGTRQEFASATLTERHILTSSGREVFFALSPEQRAPFERAIGRHVKGLFDRFLSDFNCAGCGAPTVIMWRWEEGAEDSPRYEPLTVLEAATWP